MNLLQALNDPNVQKFVTPIITGLIGILSGWAVNQLPPLKNANQGWRVLKLAFEAAILAVIVASWTDALKVVSGNDAAAQMAGIAYFVVLVFLLFAIADDVWRLVRKSSPSLEADREAARKRDKRQALMAGVRKKWIIDVLENENSLYRRSRIELGMEECPDLLRKLEFQQSGQARRQVSRSILEEFSALGEGATLLILGEPGAGKTTLLLELARGLLDRGNAGNSQPRSLLSEETLQAEWNLRQTKLTELRRALVIETAAAVRFQLEQQIQTEEAELARLERELGAGSQSGSPFVALGIPVVLNLSSWGTVKVAGEAVKTFKEWLIEELYVQYGVRREVGTVWLHEEELTLLLDGLDEVRQEWREECVAAINQFQRDHGATEIVVCSRVADYANLTNSLENFREAVFILPLESEQVEEYLQQVGTPLEGVQRVLQQDQELLKLARQPLFLSILSLAYRDKSADELLNQSNSERLRILFDRYIQQMFEQRQTDAKTQKQMKRWLGIIARQMGSEKEFLIERMQPRKWLQHFADIGQYRLLSGMIFGLMSGLIIGVTTSLSTFIFIQITEEAPFTRSLLSSVFGLARILFYSLVFGLISGLFCGLVFWFTKGITSRIDSIEPVETLQISIPNEVRRKILSQLNQWLPLGLVFGLIVGLFFGLIIALNSSNKLIFDLFNLFFGISIGLLIGLLIGLFSSLISILKTDIRVHTYPNKGIWDSLNNVLLLCGVAFILTLLLFLTMVYGLLPIMGSNRTLGMLVSVIYIPFFVAFLSGGGLTCIQHLALRLVLYRAKLIPWNFVTFFQQAEDRLFIQRTGGSYIFVHRYLQEHFASLRD